MTRQEREMLNAMSKAAFGTASKWQKLLKGQRSVLVQRDSQGQEQPVLKNGSFQYITEYSSVEELVAYMQNALDKKDKPPG
jgi:TfoX/Sxy family transcriptional regulator of competence genes